MPLPTQLQAGDKIYSAQLPNITAATVQYIPVLSTGRVKRMSVVPTVVTATGSATFQLAYAPAGSSTFTNIVSGLATVASATAAGLSTQVDLTPSTDAAVQDGGTIRVTVGGTATGGGTPIVSVAIGA